MFNDDAEVAGWCAVQIPHMNGEGFGPCSAIGFTDKLDRPAGGIVYHAFQPQYGNIQISFVVTNPKCLSRHLLTALLRYPFVQLGVQRVTVITPADERTSVWRFLSKFGFAREGRIRKGLGTEDAIIWGLLESEWRGHRYNVERIKKRRRRRGTLRLEGVALH